MFIFALVYLSLPVFIILFSFFNSIFLVPTSMALIMLIFCLTKQWRDADFQFFTLVKYWPLLLVSLIISYLCILLANDCHDWDKHYSLFNELIKSHWPPTREVDNQTWVLRYYLGWHTIPALFAKIFGAKLLPLAIFIWTACGLFIALQLVFHKLSKAHHFFIAALVFLFFSDLGVIGWWLTGEEIPTFFHDWERWWWSAHFWGGNTTPISSTLVVLVYAPQHIIGCALVTCLLLHSHRFTAQWGAILVVVAAMWSPFGALGTLPIIAWSVFTEGYRACITPQNLVVAPLLAIPIVLYLSLGDALASFTFIWNHPRFSLYNIVVLYIFKFLLILGVFYKTREKERGLIIALGMFLVILCCFYLGEFNTVVQRASLPAVCVMAVLMAKSLLESQGWQREFLTAYLLVGAFPVVVAFKKTVVSPVRANQDATFETSIFLDKVPWGEGKSYFHLFFVPTTNALSIKDISLMRTNKQGGI